MKIETKEIVTSIAVTAILAAVAVAVRGAVPYAYSPVWYVIPVFFVLMPFVKLAIESFLKKNISFKLLAYRMAKILLGLVLLVFMFSNDADSRLTTACMFMVFYLVLTTVETTFYLRKMKK